MGALVTTTQKNIYPIWSTHLWGPSVINSPVAGSVAGQQPGKRGKQIEVSRREMIKVGRRLFNMKESKKQKQGHLNDGSRRKFYEVIILLAFSTIPMFFSTVESPSISVEKTGRIRECKIWNK